MGLTARSVTLVAAEGATGAGEAIPTDAAQNVLELTETDSGRSIEITLGTSIVLRLTSQRSTGYTWIIDEVDNEILVPDGEPQYAAGNNRLGAEESLLWSFKSVSSGETTLKLIYARPFEKEQLPLKSFELRVEVGIR
jgi:inhibitor of cysteine peptidase